MTSSSVEERTVSFKIFREDVPRFSITCRDKKDLYQSFKKKIAELNLRNGTVYWIDDDSDPYLIENADDLFAASKEDSTVKLFARVGADVSGSSDGSDSNPELASGEHRHKRASMKEWRVGRHGARFRSRSRSRSYDHTRSRSRSVSRSRSRKHSNEPRHKRKPAGSQHFAPFHSMRAFFDRLSSLRLKDHRPRPASRKGRHGHSRRPWACWGKLPF
ncbi:hypothetical protein Aduo_001076 [Ancylostoma duodenale]